MSEEDFACYKTIFQDKYKALRIFEYDCGGETGKCLYFNKATLGLTRNQIRELIDRLEEWLKETT